jgi:hypothetical protein
MAEQNNHQERTKQATEKQCRPDQTAQRWIRQFVIQRRLRPAALSRPTTPMQILSGVLAIAEQNNHQECIKQATEKRRRPDQTAQRRLRRRSGANGAAGPVGPKGRMPGVFRQFVIQRRLRPAALSRPTTPMQILSGV